MASGDLVYQEVFTVSGISTPQRTALVAFITTLAWPGQATDLTSLEVRRANGSGSIDVVLRGTRQVAPGVLPVGVYVESKVP